MLYEHHKNHNRTKSRLFDLNSNCDTVVNGDCAGFELLLSCSAHPGGVVGSKAADTDPGRVELAWIGGVLRWCRTGYCLETMELTMFIWR